jgi:hypothetical protein
MKKPYDESALPEYLAKLQESSRAEAIREHLNLAFETGFDSAGPAIDEQNRRRMAADRRRREHYRLLVLNRARANRLGELYEPMKREVRRLRTDLEDRFRNYRSDLVVWQVEAKAARNNAFEEAADMIDRLPETVGVTSEGLIYLQYVARAIRKLKDRRPQDWPKETE